MTPKKTPFSSFQHAAVALYTVAVTKNDEKTGAASPEYDRAYSQFVECREKLSGDDLVKIDAMVSAFDKLDTSKDYGTVDMLSPHYTSDGEFYTQSAVVVLYKCADDHGLSFVEVFRTMSDADNWIVQTIREVVVPLVKDKKARDRLEDLADKAFLEAPWTKEEEVEALNIANQEADVFFEVHFRPVNESVEEAGTDRDDGGYEASALWPEEKD